MKVNSKEQAWVEADKLFPIDYIKDEKKSNTAGYDIYYSTCDGVNAWISDLDNRLEVNLPTGETINVWIEEEPQFKEYQISDALKVINNAIYKIDDNVDSKLAEVTGIEDARNKLFVIPDGALNYSDTHGSYRMVRPLICLDKDTLVEVKE